MFFIRTEESKELIQEAMERNRSVRRWAFAGCSPAEHFLFAIPSHEKVEAIQEMGYDVSSSDEAVDVYYAEIDGEDIEEGLIDVLNLTELDDGGHGELLDGLCALEMFDEKPKPEECEEDLDGDLFPYLVCYEGEFVGYDPDEDWPLFKAERVVWVTKTGQTARREREI